MKSFMGTALVFFPRGRCPPRRVAYCALFPIKQEEIAIPKRNSLHIQQRTNVNGNLMFNKYNRSENILQRHERNKYASYCTNRHFCTSLKIKSFNEPFQPLQNHEPDYSWNCQADLTYQEEKTIAYLLLCKIANSFSKSIIAELLPEIFLVPPEPVPIFLTASIIDLITKLFRLIPK